MVSFVELPYEIRLEVFKQLESSEDAVAFRNMDKSNHHLFTSTCFQRYGFLQPEELLIFRTLYKDGLMSRYTKTVFGHVHIATFKGNKEDFPTHSEQENDAVVAIVRGGNESEHARRHAMDVMRWLCCVEIERWKCDYVEDYEPKKEFYSRLVEAGLVAAACLCPSKNELNAIHEPNCGEGKYMALSGFLKACYENSSEQGGFHKSGICLYARFLLRVDLDALYVEDPSASILSENCDQLFGEMKAITLFMKCLQRLYQISASNVFPKPKILG
ncbi:hypothetical protein BJ508DRAFT_327436 [Ascobolus immersus RN42]|uniref:F-box domain-containing protein n=1 Tax=Ascobolus immersus RN42 TaxID=1160509 RepID=A0A3N4I2L0_ASCIM|nr:hypothetical protein BJ508DRAFT_327436 [Ascobolus immersus RN42]